MVFLFCLSLGLSLHLHEPRHLSRVALHSVRGARRQEDAACRHPWLGGDDMPDGAAGLPDHAAAEEGQRAEENGPGLPKRGSATSSY